MKTTTNRIKIFSLLLSIFCSTICVAQKMSWRDHKDIAEKSLSAGDYAQAARNFKQAWQSKKSKLDLLYEAGKAYYLTKNYKEAANAFGIVTKKTKKFPDVSFQLGRAYKSNGQYLEAKASFANFIKNYKADDKPQWTELVSRELEGCDLGLNSSAVNTDITIKYPGLVVNTSNADFAPVPFGDNALYFSSNRKGTAKIYRTELTGTGYSKPTIPTIVNKDDKSHYANGSFSANFDRFYFTICQERKDGTGLESKCNIYVILKENEKWSEPIKLRDYINDSLSTNTQPSVVVEGDKEILYFTSNRAGGLGGTDIWYCERDLLTKDLDFTYPRNCGKEINTLGDERTPWYNEVDGSLYFSTNGNISIGGFDIFKAKGSKQNWMKVSNMGQPINSSADDLYYVERKGLNTGYFVSNRKFENFKTSTENEDIFAFDIANKNTLVTGRIINSQTEKPLNDARVSVFEVQSDSKQVMIDSKFCPDGNFIFQLAPEKKYKLVASKNEFESEAYPCETNAKVGTKISKNFILKPETNSLTVVDIKSTQTTDTNIDIMTPTVTLPKKIKKTTGPSSPQEASAKTIKYQTPERNSADTAAKLDAKKASFYRDGGYFLIQMAAAKAPITNTPQFDKLKLIGSLEVEPVPDKDMMRLLLAWWEDQKSALDALSKVKKAGFKQAFLIEYTSGSRIRAIF